MDYKDHNNNNNNSKKRNFHFTTAAKPLTFNVHLTLCLIVLMLNDCCWCYGFDAVTSCSPNIKQTRKGRAQILAAIPCDLTVQAYCAMPGSAYPWNAVRRFVHENQGLMKRMYGDVRHIAILKNEFFNNEIDVNDIEMASERYTRDRYHRSAKFKHHINHNDEKYDNIDESYENNDDDHASDNNDNINDNHIVDIKSKKVSNEPEMTTDTTKTSAAITLTTLSSTVVEELPQPQTEEEIITITTKTTATTIPIGSIKNNKNRTIESVSILSPSSSALNGRTFLLSTFDTPITDDVINSTYIDSMENDPSIITTPAISISIFNVTGTKENISATIERDISKLQLNDKLIQNDTATTITIAATVPTTTTTILNGDNIEIIESPQLNLFSKSNTTNNINNNTTRTTTITTTPKIATVTATAITSSTKTTTTTPTIPPSTLSTLRNTIKMDLKTERPQLMKQRKPIFGSGTSGSIIPPYSSYSSISSSLQRYRPSSQYLYKYNSTISAKLKLKINSTDFTTTPIRATALPNIIGNNKSNNSNNINTNSTIKINTLPLRPSPIKYNVSNNNKINYNQYINKYAAASSIINHSSGASSATNVGSEFLLNEKLRKPLTSTHSPLKPLLHDNQLYQDSMKQDLPTITNIKGVNACPVKEEVVAPFWANNTRGEILALLNLYPFEQYVHWEKCTHEHKQMYCRDGCRCEQQYRLHRLLAYDPHNECRGIFSDWFRFPSCCICKCYNIPAYDLRTTSRSPRSEWYNNNDNVNSDVNDNDTNIKGKHPLEVAEEFVKSAIYEYATEDRYRPTNDYHFF